MDIGGTNLRTGLVSEDGTILLRRRCPSPVGMGVDAFMARIDAEISGIQKSAKESNLTVVAVGICVPGLIDANGRIISSVNLKELDGYYLKDGVSLMTGLGTVIMNDANGAALAEKRYGAGRPFSSILHFTLGTGVGSGLILNDALWMGSDGVAAEYGHSTVEPDGILCRCGNHGCLEQYASSTSIARSARELIFSGNSIGDAAETTEEIDTASLARRAYKGDQLAISCFANAGRYLGIASASAINLLNLDAVILGGGVAESFDLLSGYIRKEINDRCFSVMAERVKVLQGELGDDAGLIGAAAAAWELT